MFLSEHPGVIGAARSEEVTRVLVVEGDGVLRAQLAAALANAGHDVETTSSGTAALALARASAPDIIVFDLNLPDTNGLVLCQALRETSGLVVLTSAADEEARVAAFEAGADDYVTKPHSMRELVLRVRALARRRNVPSSKPDTLTVGALTIDRAARRVDVAGSAPDLTRREFDLLVFLAEHVGRVQTRDRLVHEVWKEQPESARVVDTTVKRLRQKLGAAAPTIRTLRGVGYQLVVE